MKYLPQWEPNNGNGKGRPSFDVPLPVFRMSSIGATMQASLLGTNYQLTENGSDPLLYENTNSGLSVRLNQQPLADSNAKEYLVASVSLPSASIQNSQYGCDETSAHSSIFENSTPGVVMSFSGLNASSVDSMNVQLLTDNFTTDFNLSETGANTNIFSGGGLTAKISGNSTVGGSINLALTSTSLNLVNTVVHVTWNGTKYRNFAPPTSASLPREKVADFASFYIQVPVNLFPEGEEPKIKIKAKVAGQDQEIAEVKLISTGQNNWRSEKVLILSSMASDTNEMTAEEKDSHQVIKVPEGAEMDWTKGGGELKIDYKGAVIPVKAQASGIVLQSLDFWTKAGQSLDPETRFKKPFQEMGYTMYSDYNAPRAKTLNDYVKGKQIWYSMSHGATQDGTPQTEFGGLEFVDGFIKATDLATLNLNYRLVIVDGCVSAQTSTTYVNDAYENDFLLDGSREFAEKFGDKAAYVGWGWTMEPNSAQTWSAEFVRNLKGNKSVQEAFDQFRKDHRSDLAAKLFKLYRNGENIVDIKANPNATTKGE